MAHSSVSASLRKGATVAIWNFHRLFNEESGDVVTFALCSYSTFQVIEFSTSSENNEKWLNSTVNAFKLFSEYTLSDAATLCCIVCQLEEKWIFLPWQVIFEYAKKLFCSLGLNLEKCEAKPESQVEAHYRSSRCTSLGPGPPFLKRLQKVPTIREVTQRNLVLKQGLTYCKLSQRTFQTRTHKS